MPKNERRIAYALTEIEPGNTIYDRIGFSRVNKDGSETIFLRALPASGRLQLRVDDKDARDQKGHNEDGDATPPGKAA